MANPDNNKMIEEVWGPILGFIAALVLLIGTGIVCLIIAISVFAALYLINANRIITVCIGAIGIITALLLYGANIDFILFPLKVTGQLFSMAGQGEPALKILLSPPPDFFGLFFSNYFKMVMEMEAWSKSFPLGIVMGSMGYAAYLSYYQNGVSITKRTKDQVKGHKRVGSFAASLGNNKEANTSSGSIIGTDRFGKTISLNDSEANQHVLVLGTTGSGKTVTISNVVESAINRGLPLIYIDGKGDYDLGRRICEYAQKQDRPAWLFGMRGDSVSYDPLSSGGYTSKKDRIIELRDWSEEHYKKLAEGYLQSVFKVMHELKIPSDLMSLSAHLDLKKLKSLVRENEKKLSNAHDLMDMLNAQDQASKSIESLVAEIRNFTNSEIGHLFKPQEGQEVLTLDSVIRKGGIAYFCLPALEFPSMSQTLGRLIINDLKATVGQNLSNPDRPALYAIFDEFSVFAGEQVLNVINMGRSAGIHAILATQSLSDIASGRKDNADHFINQVVGNCNTFILHRQNAPEDAKTLAEMIGTRPSLEYTAQISQKEPTHMGTVRRTRGFLAHPDEIKSLGTGEAFYVSKHSHKVTRIKARMSRI